MRTALALTAALLLVLPLSAAQNAALPDVAAALGAAGLKSLEYSGSGGQFQAWQSAVGHGH